MTQPTDKVNPSLAHALLDNKLLGWWLSQRTDFTEFRSLVSELEAHARTAALNEAIAICTRKTFSLHEQADLSAPVIKTLLEHLRDGK